MPALQFYDNRFTDGVFGTSEFGTAAFGGPAWAPVPIELHVPSDDVSDDGAEDPAEIVHRRYGVIVGARKYATIRRWRVSMRAVQRDTVESMRQFFRARRFWLLQDDDEAGRRVEVYWVGSFEPQNMRGGFFNLDFELEEIL